MAAVDFDSVDTLASKLQLKAAELLIKIKDESYSTLKVFNLITNGVDDLYNVLISIIQAKFMSFGRDHVFSVGEICSILSQFEGNSMFEGIHSPDELSKFVEQERSLVRPFSEDVTQIDILTEGGVKKVTTESGYVVPFLQMLEALLNCPEVLHCVDNPKQSQEGVFASPLDGLAYKNHPLVKKYPGTLAIRTYDDDACVTDSKSSQDVSIRFIYWTLLNIYPELRASNRAIHLLSCVKTEIIKAKGHKAFMSDYIEAMKKLCSEEGVSLTVMGQQRTFRAVMVDHNADNPAAASLGGFKESHFAHCYCRQCLVVKEDLYKSFDEKDFVRRSKETHEIQLNELEEYITTKANKKPSPSVKYGINSRSPLMEIPHVDVTKCFPQDLMHDVILGCLKQEIVCILKHALGKQKISLRHINEKIASLVKYCGVNKPAPIEQAHLDKNKLRSSASETLGLAYLLPFALLDKNGQSVCDEENLNCYVLRLELLSLQMSDEFTLKDIEKLRKMTIDHHTRFQTLYPDEETPKLHFEVHLPTQIIFLGPLRQHWCFRFEGKHAYFKRLCRLIHNYVNICESLSTRHQERQCGLMMLGAAGHNMTPYLRTSEGTGVPKPLVLEKCGHKDLLKKIFTENLHEIKEFNYVDKGGVHYTKGTAIVCKFIEDVPICGEIVAVYGNSEEKAFVYLKLETEKYEVKLNAFKVSHREVLGVIRAKDIAYWHRVTFIRDIGQNYIQLWSKSYLARQY